MPMTTLMLPALELNGSFIQQALTFAKFFPIPLRHVIDQLNYAHGKVCVI